MRSFYKKKKCRLCDSKNLKLILDLGKTPPGNNLKDNKIKLKNFPLQIFFCLDCSHSQLGHIVDPKFLFQKNYTYLSSISNEFVDHLRNYADLVIKKLKLKKNSIILDIGSNDGTCLKFFKQKGMKVIGVDPAKNIASIANKKGIYTIPKFFNKKTTELISQKYKNVDLITSHNCLAHIDDLKSIFMNSYDILSDRGCLIFEVGYFYQVIKNNWFDTIYHEHLDYHMFTPLYNFLLNNNFNVFDVEIVKPQGGSIRIYCKKKINLDIKISSRVKKLIEKEKKLKINRVNYYYKFRDNLFRKKTLLKDILINLSKNKKVIYGYGAPTKATTLMKFFDINKNLIKFIYEDNHLKVNKYMPNNIKIISSKLIKENKPDYILILAWNFSKSIILKHKSFIKSGGRFIIPLPEPKIISK